MPADQLGQAAQAEAVPVTRALRVEAGAVIRDLQGHQARVAAEHDAGGRGTRMLDHVLLPAHRPGGPETLITPGQELPAVRTGILAVWEGSVYVLAP